MIRQALTLFLITALILNQAAFAFAHVHEGQSDSAPHIHLPWESNTAHGHSHAAHSHSHDHLHSHQHDVPADNENDLVDFETPTDGQNEALVFVHDISYVAPSSHCLLAVFCDLMLASGATTDVLVQTELQLSKSFSDAPARSSCPIYLQTRSLRL